MKSKNSKFEREYFEGKGSAFRGYTFQEMAPIARRYLKILNQFYKSDVKKPKLLDVGCAAGIFLHFCDKAGFETYGMDISKYSISRARKITRAKLINQSADKKFPFNSNFFDVVTSFVTIEHLRNPEFMIKEVHRVLIKGGRFIMTTDNKYSFYRFLALFHEDYKGDATHISLKSISEWKKIMKNSGFEIMHSENFHFPGKMRIKKHLKIDIDKIIPWFKDGIIIIGEKT